MTITNNLAGVFVTAGDSNYPFASLPTVGSSVEQRLAFMHACQRRAKEIDDAFKLVGWEVVDNATRRLKDTHQAGLTLAAQLRDEILTEAGLKEYND